MKKFLIILTTLFAAGLIQAQTPTTATGTDVTPVVDPNAPVFTWANEIYDFGNIPQGIPVQGRYEFVNSGKSPLIISDVQRTCGCTKTEWTKEPIAPGGKGFIMAEFNAANEGPFNKAITVKSNASTPDVKLFFKGTVQKAEQPSKTP